MFETNNFYLNIICIFLCVSRIVFLLTRNKTPPCSSDGIARERNSFSVHFEQITLIHKKFKRMNPF